MTSILWIIVSSSCLHPRMNGAVAAMKSSEILILYECKLHFFRSSVIDIFIVLLRLLWAGCTNYHRSPAQHVWTIVEVLWRQKWGWNSMCCTCLEKNALNLQYKVKIWCCLLKRLKLKCIRCKIFQKKWNFHKSLL